MIGGPKSISINASYFFAENYIFYYYSFKGYMSYFFFRIESLEIGLIYLFNGIVILLLLSAVLMFLFSCYN